MSLLSKLLGRTFRPRPRHATEFHTSGEFLGRLEQLAASDPKAAISMLERIPDPIARDLDFGGSQHNRFAAVIVDLLNRQQRPDRSTLKPVTAAGLPSVQVVTDEQVGTWGELVAEVRKVPEPADLVYLRYTGEQGNWLDPALDLEGLYEFAADPTVRMVYVSFLNVFVNRAFLLSLEKDLNPRLTIKLVVDDISHYVTEYTTMKPKDPYGSWFGYELVRFFQPA
ncbi:MAG: hypothetical protein K1X53_06860 [Candidatus Sumerlaeaceae bacterium]|nr:hypothetical protein [Candidatus Sumerlaeaceae bacterium]